MQQLLLLQSQELVAGGRAGITLLLPGATGVQVHARGSDSAAMQKLRRKVAAMEIKLGILPGETGCILSKPVFNSLAPVLHCGKARLRNLLL